MDGCITTLFRQSNGVMVEKNGGITENTWEIKMILN